MTDVSPASSAANLAHPPPGEPMLVADRLFHGFVLATCLSVVLAAAVLRVRDGQQVVVPVWGQTLPELCTFRRWLGIDCPGCGLTRSFISMAHGDWQQAWRYNASGVFLFSLCVAQIPFHALQLWRGHRRQPLLRWPWIPATLCLLIGSVLLQWVLRVVPVVWG